MLVIVVDSPGVANTSFLFVADHKTTMNTETTHIRVLVPSRPVHGPHRPDLFGGKNDLT